MTYLPNDKADHTAILDALDGIANSMATNGSGQDAAVIFFSSHGEMIGGQFYLIPYDFDARTPNASATSALSASEFAKKVKALASGEKSCSCSTPAIPAPSARAAGRANLTPRSYVTPWTWKTSPS